MSYLDRARYKFAVANYCNEVIFVSGNEFGTGTEVSIFILKRNCWSHAPSLNFARHSHLSCFLGSSVYVFGGSNKTESVGSIESLQLGSDLDWRVI